MKNYGTLGHKLCYFLAQTVAAQVGGNSLCKKVRKHFYNRMTFLSLRA